MTQIPKKSLRILLKAVLLFVVFNYAFAFVPDSALWKISLYNTILPGLTRFPLEKNLDLMFDAHEIAKSPSRGNEYKVIVLGDSSTWGYKLNPDETFSSIINASRLLTCKEQTIHVYNLGYPSLSVFKDFIFLRQAMFYKPNLILWNVTLNSLLETKEEIEENVIIKNNIDLAQSLNNEYKLTQGDDLAKKSSFRNQSFLDRREEIARFIKAQLEEIRWQAIGGELVDKSYSPLGMDVKASDSFDRYNLLPPRLEPNLLRFNILNAGNLIAGDIPIIIINEPIQVVNGANSDIRYNKMYPRWVYDQYREIMTMKSKQYGWNYIDLWNMIPPTQFSDTAFHRTTKGEQIFSRKIKEVILKSACP
jgi:hypothetical protein